MAGLNLLGDDALDLSLDALFNKAKYKEDVPDGDGDEKDEDTRIDNHIATGSQAAEYGASLKRKRARDGVVTFGEDRQHVQYQSKRRSEALNRQNERQRDVKHRTVFIGNVPLYSMTSLDGEKRMGELCAPYGHMETCRYKETGVVSSKQLNADPENDTVNVYVVMETYEEARGLLALNGTQLDGNYIRVDMDAQPAKQDHTRCIFIGNLPFQTSENALWTYFGTCGDVESVRIVRDKKTKLGKGFAYVQFKTRDGVSSALLLNDLPMVDGGRALRVKRAESTENGKVKGGLAMKSKIERKQRDEEYRSWVGRQRPKVAIHSRQIEVATATPAEGLRAVPGKQLVPVRQNLKSRQDVARRRK